MAVDCRVMSAPDHPSSKASAEAARKRRLAAALRENLKRRKAQSRGRARPGEAGDGAADGPQSPPETKG